MTTFRKIIAALLVSLLVGGTAFAQAQLTTAQKAQIRSLIASGASSADIALVLTQAGVDISDPAEIADAVEAIIAEVPAAEVAAVSQAVTLAVVAAASEAQGANPNNVAAIAEAAASGATKGAVAAAAASGGDVAAAAEAASSGSATGAVTAAAQSTNQGIANAANVVAAAASTGASSGASTAATEAGVSADVVAAVSSSASSGSSSGAVAAAVATGANVQSIVQATSAPATTTTTTTTTVTTPGEVEVEIEDVEIDVPDEGETIVVRSFGLQLSYGNFVVTTTSNNNIVTVVNVASFPAGVTNIITSNGGTINDLVIPNAFIAASGEDGAAGRPLNATQLASLDNALTTAAQAANGGTVVVTVPSNTITVSPSS
ncbi:MAG: hypothetical protein SynsKO_05080 [Synoicihabitans sp.]